MSRNSVLMLDRSILSNSNNSDSVAHRSHSPTDNTHTSKRTVVTEQTTVRRRLSSDLSFQYEEDEWENKEEFMEKPKTNYTYAETSTYIKHSPTKGYKSPNMARRSLHGWGGGLLDDSAVHSTRVTTTVSQESLSSVGGFSMEVHESGSSESVGLNAGNVSGTSGSRQGPYRPINSTKKTTAESKQGNVPSFTRSGKKYSMSERLKELQRKQSQAEYSGEVTRQLHFDDTIYDQSTMHMSPAYRRAQEKRQEYAGEALAYKEADSDVPHLYGLDPDDVDHTYDSEMEDDHNIIQHRQTTSIITTIKTVITSVTYFLYTQVCLVGSSTVHATKTLLEFLLYCLAVVAYFGYYTLCEVCSGLKTVLFSVFSIISSPFQMLRQNDALARRDSSQDIDTTVTITTTTSSNTSSYNTDDTSNIQNKSTSLSSTESDTDESQEEYVDDEIVKPSTSQERLGLMDTVASFFLFIPSIIYAYFIYPIYSVSVFIFKSVYEAISWMFTSVLSAFTSVYNSVTSLWRTTEDIYESSASQSIGGSRRRSTRRSHISSRQQQEEQLQSTSASSTSASSSTSTVSNTGVGQVEENRLIYYFLYVPSLIYAYLLYPMGASLIWIVQYFFNGIKTTFQSISSVFSSDSKKIYQSSVLRSKHSVKKNVRWAPTRTTHLGEQSDSEDMSMEEDGVYSVKKTSKKSTADYIWSVVMFLPNLIYDIVSWLCHLCSQLYGSTCSNLKWLVVDNIATPVSMWWSTSHQKTASESSSSVASNNSSTVTEETIAFAAASSHSKVADSNFGKASKSARRRSTRSSTVSTDGYDTVDSYSSATVDDGYVSTTDDGRKRSTFGDCLCNALMFVPYCIYEMMRGMAKILQYCYNKLCTFSNWLFVDTIGNSLGLTGKSSSSSASVVNSSSRAGAVYMGSSEKQSSSQTGVVYVGSSAKQKSSWSDCMCGALMFFPYLIYEMMQGLARLVQYCYNKLCTFSKWLFVDTIGNSLGLTGKRSSSSASVVNSSSRAGAVYMGSSDKQSSSQTGAVYVGSTAIQKSSWSDCLCGALMFFPYLIYELMCGLERLVRYCYDSLLLFCRWLFIDTIGYGVGNLGQSGWAATKSKSQSVLSYLILTDVWVLSRSRGCGLCCLLPLLLLIPFLLCGGYYIYDQGSEAAMTGISLDSIFGGGIIKESGAYTESTAQSSGGSAWWPLILLGGLFGGGAASNDTTSTETSSIFAGWGGGGSGSDNNNADNSASTVIINNGGSDNHSEHYIGGIVLTDEQLQAKIREVFIAMYGEREAKSKEQREQNTQQILVKQEQIFNQYKIDVEEMTKNIVKEELLLFAAGTGNQRNEDMGKFGSLTQEQIDQAAKLKAVQDQMSAVLAKSDELALQISAAENKMKLQDESSRAETAAMIADLENKLAGLQALLAGQLQECCKNDSSLALLVRAGVRDELSGFMAGVMAGSASSHGGGSNDQDSSGSAFNLWMQNQFATRGDIDDRIAVLAAKLNEQIRQSEADQGAATNAAIAAASLAAIAAAKKSDMDTSDKTTSDGVNIGLGAAGGVLSDGEDNITKSGQAGGAGIMFGSSDNRNTIITGANFTGLTEQQVKLLIREALYIFGADKTGMVDYALESAGGSVVSTRCSETYHRKTAQLSVFGIPLWYVSNSPRTVIQPDVHPGQCWAFKGDHGYLVIQLAGVVKPTAFSLEHIPKTLSTTGRIDSAPKDFSVKGLEHEKDTEGYDLGSYQYNDDGEPLQYFNIKEPNVKGFPVLELTIESNWGNEEYTCLYRFRVHGQLQEWTDGS